MANSPAKALSYEDAYKKIKNPKQSKAEFIKAAKAYNTKKYGTTEPTRDSKKAGKTKAELADQFKKSQVEKKNTEVEKMEPKKAKAINPAKVPLTSSEPEKDANRKVGEFTSSNTRKELDKGTFKEDKVATEANRGKVVAEKIIAGDKKAGKKAGLKGGLKRKANRAGKEVGKKKSKDLALDKAGEATTRKEVRKSGVKGEFKRAAMDDVAAKKGQKNKKMEEIILSAATFKDFNQMDTVNAQSVAEMKAPMEMSEGPIKYFKQSIKYDNSTRATAIKVAADEKDMTHASPKGKKELKHDVSSMISHATMNKPIAYMHGKIKKGGSILSKHMKS